MKQILEVMRMKKYIASVRDKETKEIMLIEREYKNKKDFEIDLRMSGYSIRFITTPDKFDEACDKWYEACEKSKRRHQAINEIYKDGAAKYGISAAHYRRAYKAWVNDTKTLLSLEDFIEIYK